MSFLKFKLPVSGLVSTAVSSSLSYSKGVKRDLWQEGERGLATVFALIFPGNVVEDWRSSLQGAHLPDKF